MKQKSVEIDEKTVNIEKRWEKLKCRQNDEPSKFLKTLKILKNQIQDLTKSKDDIIQTIKNDLSRINSSYHSVLEKQVQRVIISESPKIIKFSFRLFFV